MPFLSFAAIIVFIYIAYYAALITGDVIKAKRMAAIQQQPVRVIPADMFMDEETAVKVDLSTLFTMEETPLPESVIHAAKPQEIKEEHQEADTDNGTGELQMETITYGIEISPENIAALFTEQSY